MATPPTFQSFYQAPEETRHVSKVRSQRSLERTFPISFVGFVDPVYEKIFFLSSYFDLLLEIIMAGACQNY